MCLNLFTLMYDHMCIYTSVCVGMHLCIHLSVCVCCNLIYVIHYQMLLVTKSCDANEDHVTQQGEGTQQDIITLEDSECHWGIRVARYITHPTINTANCWD